MKVPLTYCVLCIGMQFLLGSCKIYERKHREEKQRTAMEWQKWEQAQRFYTLQQDSLSRFWYFWTDSAFRFHADSGLLAGSGNLLLKESRSNSSTHEQNWIEKSEQGKRNDSRQETNNRSMLSLEYLWIVGLVLAILFLWKWS